MNSLMQCYYNQTTPMYAAAAVAAAAAGSEGCCATATAGSDVSATSSSSSFFSRHHPQSFVSADYRQPGLLSGMTAESTSCLQSSDVTSKSRHTVPHNDVFADALVQSNKLSSLSEEAKFAPHLTTPSVYSDYGQQVYDSSSLVSELNGQCGMYKIERPSPPATPNSEQRHRDAAEAWNPSACQFDSSSSEPNSRVEPCGGKTEAHPSQRDIDLPLSNVCRSTTSDDDDSEDLETGSASRKTSTTMTTASGQHHQQQMNNEDSCDVRQTQRGVVFPIYPWMTRVHSAHGMFSRFTLKSLNT